MTCVYIILPEENRIISMIRMMACQGKIIYLFISAPGFRLSHSSSFHACRKSTLGCITIINILIHQVFLSSCVCLALPSKSVRERRENNVVDDIVVWMSVPALVQVSLLLLLSMIVITAIRALGIVTYVGLYNLL